ncbi:MAG: L-threonylcarbamoyladenylate synthase [Firmicutes bacterium]|nr:L-threonylcarbamoyladenylate synthase [Bacillota bacterium]MCL1953663.1 L-threonylcarbamoyladenylate synthase [Bacillota bacterium]
MSKSITTKILLPTDDNIKLCADAIVDGKVVAFATETVYGLGANIWNDRALENIFEIKNRPVDNPLIVHIYDILQIERFAFGLSENVLTLAQAFWPGPLTMVFKKNSNVSKIVTAGSNTVAVRMPNSKTALSLLKFCDIPVAAPSANLSTRPSPTKAKHVYYDLQGKIEYILEDDIACKIGIESTVLDMSTDKPCILRHGAITAQQISNILDISVDELNSHSSTPSPGTRYRHYAPRIPLEYLHYQFDFNKLKQIYFKNKCVILCEKSVYDILVNNYAVVNMGDSWQYAAQLYDTLRTVENIYECIIAIGVNPQGIGQALNNRLQKASSGLIH